MVSTLHPDSKLDSNPGDIRVTPPLCLLSIGTEVIRIVQDRANIWHRTIKPMPASVLWPKIPQEREDQDTAHHHYR